ncbi:MULTISPECIES: BlaI/MecI/CopY family transcriptional regulator [unclassified Streptomyces]|uniref:BlaI/MecI/CopY family transcriptional regulator n=1 Tax=unclassified Streptomyces TaxID=2593676 RepID=UPI00081D80BF|nr:MULTISPECIES: BlaI/MecI/CopY family transcriptional regulator [unclassified Streptomyces]MYR26186.1 BlaI/MecI/CopY family transcriptional regulator [Streptomyces sp. SID4945]SCD68499.1 Predicted transcriptional regulator [Streptomyces sp. TverLS-915]SCE97513.1 Predicted transcriptional regulator [Streptomyces sp. LcepLS]
MSGTERNGGRRRGQGELEARVLAVLHSAPGPVPAGWVREHVGGELAYTTVMTILTRLRSKDAVTRERRGRSFLWSAVADEAGLAALRMRRLLDGEHDRDAVLTSFVTSLSAEDERLVRELLAGGGPEGPLDGDGAGGPLGGGGPGGPLGGGGAGGSGEG